MSEAPLVEVRNVTKTYGDLTVLHDVSLSLLPGELTLLMGPSGSGKTTLISIMVGLTRATSGSVSVCGEEITRTSEAGVARVRRKHVGFMFQTDNLFPALTALENVATVAELKGCSPKDADERATSTLVSMGLASRLHHRPGALSGGERQRVAIARAIVTRPPLVVGDEITAALDGPRAFRILELVRQAVGPTTGALLVTHDTRLVRFADRVVVLEDGRIRSDIRPDRPVLEAAS